MIGDVIQQAKRTEERYDMQRMLTEQHLELQGVEMRFNIKARHGFHFKCE